MTAFRTPIATINELNMMLAEPNSDIKHFVLVDENTQKYALPRLFEQCPILHDAGIINIASGEQHKNLETFSWIIEQLTENQADRKSLLINLGGGVISDMGGFAAACYKRGIDFVNIPTTLLAMIDAAHGGKTGVDFKSFKNQIGVFAPAKMVVIDVEFLNTLPKSEILSGFAEMIKIALITSVDFWNQIQHVDLNNLETLKPLIIEAIEKKNTIVEKDLTEQNIRKILNFGHTFGHAFETLALENNTELSHGHAVAMGMLCELWLSEQVLDFDFNQSQQISGFIRSIYPKFSIQAGDFGRLIQILEQDKKNSNHQIKLVLLKQIGQPEYNLNCSKEQCLSAFQTYCTL